jgi:hypothetical protein
MAKYLTRPEAAQFLNERFRLRIVAQTLANLACKGQGPSFFKAGGRTLYRERDLEIWGRKKLTLYHPSLQRRTAAAE